MHPEWQHAGPERHILVVDDEPSLRLLVCMFLESEGYVVETAASGDEALRVLHDRRPDVLLLDLMMPGMDGWEVLRACRAQVDLADLPVIVMSAAPSLGRPPD